MDDGMLSPAVIRRRGVREAILRWAYNVYQANPDVCLTSDQIYSGFSTGQVTYTTAEIDGELVGLVNDGMLTWQQIPNMGQMPSKGYKITNRGVDFRLANCPWDQIDRFTGKQHL